MTQVPAFIKLAAIEAAPPFMAKIQAAEAEEIAAMNRKSQEIAESIGETYEPYNPQDDIYHPSAALWKFKLRYSSLNQDYVFHHDFNTPHLNISHQRKISPHDAPMRHWKMHIQFEASQLEQAAEIVLPILRKHNVADFKFRFYDGMPPAQDPETAEQNALHARKKIVLYANSFVQGAAPTDWNALAHELEQALNAGKIRPGANPVGNRRVRNSHYLSYRYDSGSGLFYLRGKAGDSRRMPKGDADPFGKIDMKPEDHRLKLERWQKRRER